VVDIKREKDVEVLRQAAELLESENERLIAKNLELERRILEARGVHGDTLQLRLAMLEQQLQAAKRAIYAESTERRPRPKGKGEKPKQKGHGPKEQPQLAIVEVQHDLDDADKACPSCGGALALFEGQTEDSEEIDVVERRFVLKKHKRLKYRCTCVGCTTIETALGPEKLIDGGRYSLDVAIEIAIQKYLDHLPLERQVRVMKREGLDVDSQTLWDQIEALARVLGPALPRLAAYVKSQPVVGGDETWWRVMGQGESKRWQAWSLCVPYAVVYEILHGRGKAEAREVLDGLAGRVLLVDGLPSYESVAREMNITVAHCWAHARRYFVDIESTFPEQAAHALALIGRLYDVERRCPTGPPGDDERRRLRHEESRPVVDELKRWAMEQRALPEGGLGKALAYLANQWLGLTRFLDDPRIPIDNNATERGLRGIVIGRKNHYGSRSKRGTEVAALFYSLIESAKLCDVEPKAYLRAAAIAGRRGEQVPLPHELATVTHTAH